MCDFLSVLINKDCDKELRIYIGDLRSHSGTAEQHKLQPGAYREVEWTGEDEDSLAVRVEPEDHDANWYRAIILAKFKTRMALLEYCLKNGKFGGDLNLSNTKITTLPEGLKVGGDLNLSNTKITKLPEGLTVGGGLYLSNTQITKLPEGLKVGGDLNLSNTKITTLPEGLTVGGNLYLSNTPITKLPEGLEVGGDLDLRNTPITKLPDARKAVEKAFPNTRIYW